MKSKTKADSTKKKSEARMIQQSSYCGGKYLAGECMVYDQICSVCHKKNHCRKVCRPRNSRDKKKTAKTVNVDTSGSNSADESDGDEWYVGSTEIQESTYNTHEVHENTRSTHAVQENTQNILGPTLHLVDESDEKDEDSESEDEILGDELYLLML